MDIFDRKVMRGKPGRGAAAKGCSLMTAAVLSLAFFFLSAGGAGARQIIYPHDGALVEEGRVDVLGFRTPSKGAGSLSVASAGPAQKKPVKPGTFSLTIALSPGVNTITLDDDLVRVFFSGGDAPAEAAAYGPPDQHAVDNGCDDCHVFDGGEAALSDESPQLCYSCHDDFGEEEGVTLHPPVEDGECLECHAFHQAAIGSVVAGGLAELCEGCHDAFGEGEEETLHPPVEDGECLECHDAHGTAHGALLTAAPEEICFGCHDNPGLDDSGEEWGTTHPALDDGCTACHSPHASAHGSLLSSSIAPLCAECHDDKNADDNGEEWGTPHPPVEEGGCTDCHLPHGSAEPSLLVQAAPGLCSECHDDKNVDDDGNEWGTPHPPVEEGGCTDCHLPHGSAEPALLAQAAPGLCNECHDDMNADGDGNEWGTTHPPVEEGGCTDCHHPHGSAEPALLVQSVPALCEECHEPMALDESGVDWEFSHPPVDEGECLDCHKPHGSAAESLLVKQTNALCGECHTDFHDVHLSKFDAEKVDIDEDFPMTKEGLLVCTGCHAPHGSSYGFLWKGLEGELCIQCHRY